MSGGYRSRPVTARRVRRTPDEMWKLLGAITSILDGEETQITVRHLFYRLVGLGVIEKTERAYRNLVGHLGRWRRDGEIEWSTFADSTRWHIRARTFDGIADALQHSHETYRRNMWSTQQRYIELWLEKDAIASIVHDVAAKFGVPIFVCRGFASLSSLYDAAQTFHRATRNSKAVIIFHLGDYDPSGHAAADAIERTLTKDFGCNLWFHRLTVTRGQIEWMDLPTRPTKQSDSRARNWEGAECVELDSMPPSEMCAVVEQAITAYIDPHEWQQLKATESVERETLAKIRVVA
jgi:hypothetical protein